MTCPFYFSGDVSARSSAPETSLQIRKAVCPMKASAPPRDLRASRENAPSEESEDQKTSHTPALSNDLPRRQLICPRASSTSMNEK